MLAYERFLAKSGLPAPTRIMPLMVSRATAIKPALMRVIEDGRLPQSAASIISYQLSDRSLREVVLAMSGCDVGEVAMGRDRFTPEGFGRLLMAQEGREALDSIAEQSALFRRHLDLGLDGRRNAVLVDTGLFGTTMQLMCDGIADVDFSCALIARANYRGKGHATPHHGKTFGLSLEANSYSPLQRRSAMLRYWHLIESTFEPDLPSVQTFADQGGIPVSNLQIEGWCDRVEPTATSIFAGVMAYLDDLQHGDPSRVVADARTAWTTLYRAVVWPSPDQGAILNVGVRGNDFGVDTTSAARPWTGPLKALRGNALWREGEIARAKTPLRLPLLAAIETAYGARALKRSLTSRLGRH